MISRPPSETTDITLFVRTSGEEIARWNRQRIVDALTAYVGDLEENPLRGRPERLPLKLVGDGITPRYQDNDAGQVTTTS